MRELTKNHRVALQDMLYNLLTYTDRDQVRIQITSTLYVCNNEIIIALKSNQERLNLVGIVDTANSYSKTRQ